jgi:hypothetical protein
MALAEAGAAHLASLDTVLSYPYEGARTFPAASGNASPSPYAP